MLKHFQKTIKERPLVPSERSESREASRSSTANRGISISYHQNQEQGFALLLVTFIIALISILVVDFTEEINSYQNSSRQYVEKVQGKLILKSSIALARTVLEIPKTNNVDGISDPWNLLAASPLPIGGFIGELRIMIVDESGKIDINSIANQNSFNPNPPNPGDPPQNDPTLFWKNTTKSLLKDQGLEKEQFEAKSYRTLGNQTYDPSTQVAIISDWIDKDKISYHIAGFDGDGIEASAEKTWFFNRPLRSISELANIPGMTLDKIQRIAPFIKATNNTNTQININTAPYEVLKALTNFPETEINENILLKRLSPPHITPDILRNIIAGTQLGDKLNLKSSDFCLYSRIKMPRQTYWLKSLIHIKNYSPPRKTEILSSEFY